MRSTPILLGSRWTISPIIKSVNCSQGERHMWNPDSIAAIQVAARENSTDAYTKFAKLVNDSDRSRCTLRGLLEFNFEASGDPIPLEEVEPASEIVKRFCTGAMSFGSISAD